MATLNIKNFPGSLYDRLKARARREHRSVAQEVAVLLTAALEAAPPRSSMQLEGLGKELWQGVDAAAHVEAARSAWD